MDIYTALKVNSDATKSEIKAKYYRQMTILHPRTKGTGDECAFQNLQNAYIKYLMGDDFVNCFTVCTNAKREVECRCGGSYIIEVGYVGRLECEYCSCFIMVEEPLKELN